MCTIYSYNTYAQGTFTGDLGILLTIQINGNKINFETFYFVQE